MLVGYVRVSTVEQSEERQIFIVYLTKHIDAEHLIQLYEKVNSEIRGKVAIKLHTGEPHGSNIIPLNSRTYPIILWHGIGQSGRSFESTPDGREGYQAILPRLRACW